MIEKAEGLSLEVLTIEMPKSKARAAKGGSVEVDCVARIKINGDDASIIAAAEHFLSKSEGEIKNIVRPILEKHLRTILGASSLEELTQNPGACADRVQAAASMDLASMGLSVISFSIQNPHAV
jgi:flotillin